VSTTRKKRRVVGSYRQLGSVISGPKTPVVRSMFGG